MVHGDKNSSKLDNCRLYGRIGSENHDFYHYFNLSTGYAAAREEAYKVNDNAEIPKTHPSYGLVGFSRRTGGKRNLFGSSITHDQSITLTIKEAEHTRDLNHDWYFGRKSLIEIELSELQFAQLLTTMNVGDGVTCTIRSKGSEKIQDPSFVSKIDTFNKEFANRMHNLGVDIDKQTREALEILDTKKNLTKSDIEIIKKAFKWSYYRNS